MRLRFEPMSHWSQGPGFADIQDIAQIMDWSDGLNNMGLFQIRKSGILCEELKIAHPTWNACYRHINHKHPVFQSASLMLTKINQ